MRRPRSVDPTIIAKPSERFAIAYTRGESVRFLHASFLASNLPTPSFPLEHDE